MRKAMFPILALLAMPAAAQTAPQTVEVRLSNFDYTPGVIRLRAGEAVTLKLVNSSGGGHNFSAPAFFEAARLLPGANPQIREGTVEVRSRQIVTMHLVPARGTYRLRCTHTLHSTLGMRGQIIAA